MSFAGYVFLLAFFVWGSLNLGKATPTGKRGKGLWGTVVGYATVVTAAQVGVQLAFVLAEGDWATKEPVKQWLALAGFRKGSGPLQIALVKRFCSIHLTLLASWRCFRPGRHRTSFAAVYKASPPIICKKTLLSCRLSTMISSLPPCLLHKTSPSLPLAKFKSYC